jgi:hypothetical protein
MPEKDPTTYSLLTYAWVLLLAGLGGVVSFVRKVKQGHSRAFNVAELVGELVTSAFAGILTFWLCEAAEIRPLITAAFVGIAGHMGSRAIFYMETIAASRFRGNDNGQRPLL